MRNNVNQRSLQAVRRVRWDQAFHGTMAGSLDRPPRLGEMTQAPSSPNKVSVKKIKECGYSCIKVSLTWANTVLRDLSMTQPGWYMLTYKLSTQRRRRQSV